MTSFISTLGYKAGETIKSKVMARNSKGFGPESLESVSTIVAQTPPTIAPTNFIGNSSLSTAITLTWSPVIGNINTGFSTI